MKLLIDGYNVTHKIELLQGKKLQQQREELIKLLETAQANNKLLKEITIIFDGVTGIVVPAQRYSVIKVLFSRGSCADKKIKEILENSKHTRDITVVSDDREVRAYVHSLGAKRISVDEFTQLLFSSCRKKEGFRLDARDKVKINRELEQIWLKGK